ncbi:MAG: D-alanyl-D-alanine carboxypeptidase family protein, partial [Clostridiales bacterium]|nr:D-alanyl-D-alanine carboxypeptidase family protein [Clostridiales bacterium]
ICADILNGDYAGRPTMTQDFKWTPEAQWMKENCDTFGFILRFLEEKEDVTGIKFEPWHFRYVGKEIASYIMANGMTLEEFTEEAQEAVADFESRGGDVEEQLAYEYSRLNAPPESYVLDELGEDGDAEVSLVF